MYTFDRTMFSTSYIMMQAARHFEISHKEAEELFSATGCDNAGMDRKKALAYVEAFIARKLTEKPMPDDPSDPDDETDEETDEEAV